jgi:O-antigen/teichoic acid export membrane protein
VVAAATQSVVKRNIATNVIGGGWTILLNLLAIPVQIRILGAEAYGLIGFVASLQSILIILDFGIPTTLIREVARDTSPDHRAIHALIRTSSTIYWAVAGAVVLAIIAGAGWIAQHWLIVETLTPEYVAGGMRIMAFYVLFTWPLNIYVGALSGLQRLDLVNLLRVISVTAAQVGGILILLVWHDLYVFLGWLAVIALLNLIAHAWMTHRLLPGLPARPGFSVAEVKRVWSFSLDMNLISTLAIVYTQTDRLLIGTLLPLRFLGYYNVAYNVTRGIATLQGFLSSAVLPALAADHGRNQHELMSLRYNKYAQVSVYLIALPSFVLMFFGRDILAIWTSSGTAANVYLAMGLLAFGTLLNSAMVPAYILAIATGNSRLPLLVNLYGLIAYLPILYFLIAGAGIEGAALTWIFLNLYYMIVFIPWVQQRILNKSTLDWFRKNFAPFFLLGILFWGARGLTDSFIDPNSLLIWGVYGGTVGLYAIAGFFLLSPQLRNDVLTAVFRVWSIFPVRRQRHG